MRPVNPGRSDGQEFKQRRRPGSFTH